MQDRDTDISIGIDCATEPGLANSPAALLLVGSYTVWMPDWSFEFHLWRHEGIILREAESGFEKSSSIELTVVGDHQHHLPLINIVVN